MKSKDVAELIKFATRYNLFCEIRDSDEDKTTVRITVYEPEAILESKFDVTIRKIPMPTLVGEGEYYE